MIKISVAQPIINLKFVIKVFVTYFVLSISCFLMLRTIIGYTSFRDDVQFLLFKQDYIDNQLWKIAFYIHVFSAVMTLFAGYTQFSSQFLEQHRALHRLVGKIYIFTVLVINVPVGMIMALYANGGFLGKAAFVLLDILWFLFTYKAVIAVKSRDFVNHRNHMIRSYALTCSAITLRTWKIILSYSFDIEPEQLYIIYSWMGFVPNLVIAEWYIRFITKQRA